MPVGVHPSSAHEKIFSLTISLFFAVQLECYYASATRANVLPDGGSPSYLATDRCSPVIVMSGTSSVSIVTW